MWFLVAVVRIWRMLGRGISSWRIRRSGWGVPREVVWVKVWGVREWLAPGERRMRFSPLSDSTRITATPVDWFGMVWTEVVSMREDLREEMRDGPNSSSPTAPIILSKTSLSKDGVEAGLGLERRAHATA